MVYITIQFTNGGHRTNFGQLLEAMVLEEGDVVLSKTGALGRADPKFRRLHTNRNQDMLCTYNDFL